MLGGGVVSLVVFGLMVDVDMHLPSGVYDGAVSATEAAATLPRPVLAVAPWTCFWTLLLQKSPRCTACMKTPQICRRPASSIPSRWGSSWFPILMRKPN